MKKSNIRRGRPNVVLACQPLLEYPAENHLQVRLRQSTVLLRRLILVNKRRNFYVTCEINILGVLFDTARAPLQIPQGHH